MKRPFFLKGKVIAKATEGRDWVIILFSLLLAFFIWIVHYLSHTTPISVAKVVAITTTRLAVAVSLWKTTTRIAF